MTPASPSRSTFGRLGAAGVAIVALAACSPTSNNQSAGPCAHAKTAASVADCGGMSALIAQAKLEGKLNVIALPRNWVNYGGIIDGFEAKYGIAVVSIDPNGASQDEINAVEHPAGAAAVPDVLDLRTDVAAANEALFAPYMVQTWGDVYANQKESTGLWVQDYGGFMAVGYDSSKVPAITSLDDLLAPTFHTKVALKGDPSQNDAALYAVMMANLAERGSLTDIQTGVDFFHRLKAAGNFNPLPATQATVTTGTTPVVFDWEYLSHAHEAQVSTWKTFVPVYPSLGSFFAQAINKDARHPAAARLWEEYLYSDEGQNLWLKGGARPVRLGAMQQTLSSSEVPNLETAPILLSADQIASAKAYLTTHWKAAIS